MTFYRHSSNDKTDRVTKKDRSSRTIPYGSGKVYRLYLPVLE